MATAPRTSFDSLQAGRAFAALAVVVHHAALAAQINGGSLPFSSLLDAGYLGVDFFFVLSGFIIYHSTVGRGKSAAIYAKCRAKRIYLPYLPIGLAMALVYTVLPSVSHGSTEWSWLTSLTLAPVTPHPALLVAWTLQHELLFYALFGIFYFSGYLVPGLIIWGCAIIASAIGGFDGGIPLRLINLEFLMGIGAAVLADRRFAPTWLYAAAIVPVGCWIMLGAERDLSILVGLSFMLAILPTVRLEREGRFRVSTALVFLGAASYSLYLVHNPIISVTRRIVSVSDPTLILLLGIVASLAAGCAYYLWVERSLLGLRNIDRRSPVPPNIGSPAPQQSCAMATITAAGSEGSSPIGAGPSGEGATIYPARGPDS